MEAEAEVKPLMGNPALGQQISTSEVASLHHREAAKSRQSLPCEGKCSLDDEAAGESGRASRKLWLALGLCTLCMLVEAVGGLVSNSLAVLADAAHLLADAAGLLLALLSLWASGWGATPRLSYGYRRVEVLGALITVVTIWLVAGTLVKEAADRLLHHSSSVAAPVNGKLMFLVAGFGVTANLVMVVVLGGHHHHHHHHHHDHDNGHCEHHHEHELNVEEDESQRKGQALENLNLRGAYLHTLGDLIQSVGVLLSGAVIWFYPKMTYLDLGCTLLFSSLVLVTTLPMLRDVVAILMECTPSGLNLSQIAAGLERIAGVTQVHDLHVWQLTVGKVLLSCHLRIKPGADHEMVLRQATTFCHEQHKIRHVTIQVEQCQGLDEEQAAV